MCCQNFRDDGFLQRRGAAYISKVGCEAARSTMTLSSTSGVPEATNNGILLGLLANQFDCARHAFGSDDGFDDQFGKADIQLLVLPLRSAAVC
jgi:hypothetical protein